MDSCDDTPKGWVAPFGHPRINACSRLPVAFRSVPRPSSPPGAKASTECPSHARSPHHAREQPIGSHRPPISRPRTMKQQAQPSALSIRHTRNERATFKRAVTSHTSLIASIAIRTTTPPTHAPPLTEQHTGTQGRSDKPARTATTRDVTRT